MGSRPHHSECCRACADHWHTGPGDATRRQLLLELPKQMLATERLDRTLSWWRQRRAGAKQRRRRCWIWRSHTNMWCTTLVRLRKKSKTLSVSYERCRFLEVDVCSTYPARPSRNHHRGQDYCGGLARVGFLLVVHYPSLECGKRHCGPHCRPAKNGCTHREPGGAHAGQ